MKTVEIEETLPNGEVVIRIAVIPDDDFDYHSSIHEGLDEETDLEPTSRVIVWEM